MTLPPPLPGLTNALAATAPVSYLANPHHTLHPPLPSAQKYDLHARHEDTLITVHGRDLVVHAHPRLEMRLPFAPQALCAADGIAVVVGTPGVQIVRLRNPAAFQVLPASEPHAFLSVGIGHGMLCAATMDARLLQWRVADAFRLVRMVYPPKECRLADVVTGIVPVEGLVLVAWWSGLLVCYNGGEVLWKCKKLCVAEDAEMVRGGAGFVVVNQELALAFFVVGRNGLVVDLQSGGVKALVQWRHVVKGLCERDDVVYVAFVTPGGKGLVKRLEWKYLSGLVDTE